jgi:hypothetical protein
MLYCRLKDYVFIYLPTYYMSTLRVVVSGISPIPVWKRVCSSGVYCRAVSSHPFEWKSSQLWQGKELRLKKGKLRVQCALHMCCFTRWVYRGRVVEVEKRERERVRERSNAFCRLGTQIQKRKNIITGSAMTHLSFGRSLWHVLFSTWWRFI